MSQVSWQEELWSSYRTASDLVGAGLLELSEAEKLAPVFQRYGFLLPRYYANLIDPHDPDCPIRAQAIPSVEEVATEKAMNSDPLQDLKFKPAPRITHRYRKRLLLHLTPNCSMYCRFCFRKSLLNELKEDLFAGSWVESLSYIRKHSEVEEVILSGGDPLMLSDTQLINVLKELDKIKSLKRIRFHSRVPVTFPVRITDELCRILKQTQKSVVMVTHFNHPKEMTDEARAGCEQLKPSLHSLLNQSVLLRGVNDKAPILEQLSQKLFEAGVLPYYLHHPDRAQGTSHFDISVEEGVQLYNHLRTELPGYLVPRYVIDRPAVPYKMSVTDLL